MHASLYLDIDGSAYHAELLGADSYCVVWQLTRCKPGGYEPDPTRQYECSWEAFPTLRRTLADGRECSCPDFQRRHAGTGSAGCKHLQALRAVRLIEPGPVSTAPESADYGDTEPAGTPDYSEAV